MAKIQILVVENEILIAWDIQNRLENLGYEVSGWTASGKEAIDHVAQKRPDLVLMDIKLKDEMDGIEAAGQLQARFDIPIIYLTAYADETTLRRARITAPYGYLLKPFGERELHIAVEIALDRHRMEQKLKDREQLHAALSRIQALFIREKDTGARFEEMLQALLALTRSDSGFIGEVLYTPEGKPHLKLYAIHGLTWDEAVDAFYCRQVSGGLEFPDLDNLFGTILMTGQPVMANDPASDPRWQGLLSHRLPVRTFLGLPISSGEEWVGLVGIANRPGGYDQTLVEWLEPILSTCAGMIVADRNERWRKQAEQEIRRHNRDLTVLNQVIAASAASSGPGEVLAVACHKLARALAVPRAGAILFNDETMTAVVAAEYPAEGRPATYASSPPITDWITCQELLTYKTPLVLEPALGSSNHVSLFECLRQHGLAALLYVPLIVEGGVLGSLYFAAIEPHHFLPEEISLASHVADQVASALARDRLMQTQQRLITAIEQVTESVVITDITGTILYVNPAFEHSSGYHRAEVIGQNSRLLKSGQQDQAFYQDMWATISSGRAWHGRFINRKKDGSLYTEDVTINPVRGQKDDITNYVAVKRDVTRELELEGQYRQAQKMQAVGLLAGGIAHDFNNILTAINGYAALIQLELPPHDPLQDMIDVIMHSGERAAELVRQLLIFSRKQIIELRVLNLNTVVLDMEKMLHRIIGEHINLSTKLDPNLQPLKADPTQLEQIILNLVVNAGDAMPHGGRLIIETTNVVLDQAYADSHLEVEPGNYIALTVSDTGVGMSKEMQAHIFEPFFTTKGPGRGTGLGLATVHGIVKQNGGSIWIYSEEDQGTTFKIYLPSVTEPVTGLPQDNNAKDFPQGTETILLVEDEPDVRELATLVLNEQGYTVLAAGQGQEALDLAQGYPQKIQLLLTDLVMPGLNGQVLAEQLSRHRSEMKVLFMSGYTDSIIAHYGILQPDNQFIQKPFSPRALACKVREVLDGQENGSDNGFSC